LKILGVAGAIPLTDFDLDVPTEAVECIAQHANRDLLDNIDIAPVSAPMHVVRRRLNNS
jgi:hypothetical protein